MERDNIETSSVWGLTCVQEKSTHLYILYNIFQILRVFADNMIFSQELKPKGQQKETKTINEKRKETNGSEKSSL